MDGKSVFQVSTDGSVAVIRWRWPYRKMTWTQKHGSFSRAGLILKGALLFLVESAGAQDDFEKKSADFFGEFCTACHGEKKQKANVALHNLPVDLKSATSSRQWLDFLAQLESGEMPRRSGASLRMMSGLR